MNIRKYRSSDRSSIVKLMEKFGDYLVSVDSIKRLRRMPGYSEYFTQKMLDGVKKNHGLIYIAEHEHQVIGFIAGIFQRQSKEELLDTIPTKAARVIELFVDEKYRLKNIGATLVKRMEEDFRRMGCDVARVEVFGPNVDAHRFYRKLGYQDRNFDLIKTL